MFILNWKQMTFVSWISVIATIAVTSILVYNSIYISIYDIRVSDVIAKNANASTSHNIAGNLISDMSQVERICLSFVLFITGISGNAMIPRMAFHLVDKDKSKMQWVIIVSYLFVTVFYTIIGALGYHIYGPSFVFVFVHACIVFILLSCI
jgi:amino acid permease